MTRLFRQFTAVELSLFRSHVPSTPRLPFSLFHDTLAPWFVGVGFRRSFSFISFLFHNIPNSIIPFGAPLVAFRIWRTVQYPLIKPTSLRRTYAARDYH
jgi:hypothetical protein